MLDEILFCTQNAMYIFVRILPAEKIYFGCALSRNNQQYMIIVLRTLANDFIS